MSNKVFWAILLDRANSEAVEDYHLNVAITAGAHPNYTRLRVPYGRTDIVRNVLARRFVSSSSDPNDWLVMLDSDHAHPPDVIERLIANDVPVVGGLAYQRGGNYKPCFFLRSPDGRLGHAHTWGAGGLYPCVALGHAALAVRRSVFTTFAAKRILFPWWRYVYEQELVQTVQPDGSVGFDEGSDVVFSSEDMYFSRQVELAGIPMYCDTSVMSPHHTHGWIDHSSWEQWRKDHPTVPGTIVLELPQATVGHNLERPPAPAQPAAPVVVAEDGSTAPKRTMPTAVDIIVPGYNKLELTERLLKSLLGNTAADTDYRVVYVDDGSNDIERVKRLGGGRVDVIGVEHGGFISAVNHGLNYTRVTNPAPIVMLLNNDVEIPSDNPGWLKTLLSHFADPQVGAVGAVSDKVYGYQKRGKTETGPMLVDVPFLIGFAMAVRRSAWEQIGLGLDPRYGMGNYEDMDLSVALRRAGYKLLVDQKVWLFHTMHATFGDLGTGFSELLDRNRRLFATKWGGMSLLQMGVITAEELDRLGLPAQAGATPPASTPADPGSVPGKPLGDPVELLGGPRVPTLGVSGVPVQPTDPAPALRDIYLVTHTTSAWAPKLTPYVASMHHSPWINRVIGVGGSVTGLPAWVTSVEGEADEPGAPERTASLQHGAFCKYLPGAGSDVLIYTDGDIVLQRSPGAWEQQMFLQLKDGEVVAGPNKSPEQTLRDEAQYLQPQEGWEGCFDANYFDAPGSIRNIGVIAATRNTWAMIYEFYLAKYATAQACFHHPARQQWLVCYAVAKLGLSWLGLPYLTHMQGCWPLPEGGAWDGAVATYNGQPVLFRHHIP